MTDNSNRASQTPDFKQIISGYTNQEIRTVLKKRKLYQKEAADFAVQEAIRRGIIHSEQDLIASEFRYSEDKFSIFPVVENEKAKSRFKKSIGRSLLVLGVLPLIFGGIKIFDTQSVEGILMFVFGAIWILFSFKLMRAVNTRLIYGMFLLVAITAVFIVNSMLSNKSLNAMDILITLISMGFITYGIGFLRKLND